MQPCNYTITHVMQLCNCATRQRSQLCNCTIASVITQPTLTIVSKSLPLHSGFSPYYMSAVRYQSSGKVAAARLALRLTGHLRGRSNLDGLAVPYCSTGQGRSASDSLVQSRTP